MFSLGFTGILLMCASAFLMSIDPMAMAYQELGDCEFSVYLSPPWDAFAPYVPIADNLLQNNPLDQDFIAELTEGELLRDMVSVKGCTANIFFPGDVNVEGQPYYEIVGLSREYLEGHQEALLSGTLDYDTLVEGHGIIIDDSTGVVERFANYKAAIGDITQIETDEGEKLPFQVMASVNLGDQRYKGYFIFVPQDLLNEIKVKTENFNIKLLFHADIENIAQAEERIYDLCGDNQNLAVQSINEAASYMEQSLKIMMRAVYGVVIFIGIFALVNLVNTLMTNFISRQQEYGILRSVGMSGRQLSEMLRAEAFCYVLATVVVTLVIGTILGYVLCRTFSQVGLLGELRYTFPLWPMLIFFAALAVVALGYSILAIWYSGKISLAEYVKRIS